MRSVTFGVALLAGATVLSGCSTDHGDMPMDDEMSATGDMPAGDMPMHGGSGEHTGGEVNSAAPDGARTISVEADSFRYGPSELVVGVGEGVAIELTATDVLHDFVVTEFDAHIAAAGGRTATGGFVADQVGTFAYFCSVAGHREAGMEGTLRVEG